MKTGFAETEKGKDSKGYFSTDGKEIIKVKIAGQL